MEQPDSMFQAATVNLSCAFIGLCLFVPTVQVVGQEAFEDHEQSPLITSKTLIPG